MSIFQDVPEVNEARPELDEALAFHGLTRARMTAEMIRWLESIRLEDPEAYRYFTTDPPSIAHRILRWDFAFSTGMTTDYPKRRNWTNWMALREFVQNALDIEERIFGYENIAIRVYGDEIGVHIEDRGPGITLEAFRLGGSDKACYERGYFGEGLKVAGAHFAGESVPVYVFNRRGQAFKMCVSPGTDLVVVVIGRATAPVLGTEVILLRAKISPDLLVSTVFQEWLRVHPEAKKIGVTHFAGPDCPHAKPNVVMEISGKNIDILWVRDIFVNRISNITRKKSIFGYNLWWVPLEPNRVYVSSLDDLSKNVARAFTKEAATSFLDRVVNVEEGEITTGFFETNDIDWYYTSEEVKEAVGEWVKNHGLATTREEKAAGWFSYMGVKPLVVPKETNLYYLFARAPEAEGEVIELAAKRLETADKTVVPEEALTLRELCNLGAARVLLTYCQFNSPFSSQKLPDIIICSSLPGATGTQVGNRIYMLRENLASLRRTCSTAFHEYAHYYGEKKYGGARDLTEAFEKALTEIYGLVSRAFVQRRVVNAFIRALKGGWKADAFEWKEGMYHTKPPLIDAVTVEVEKLTGVERNYLADWEPLREKIERTAPVVAGAMIVPERKLEPTDFVTSAESVTDIVPLAVPPNKEMYLSEIKKVAEKVKEHLYGKKAIIFMYDPWLDSYRVLEKVGI